MTIAPQTLVRWRHVPAALVCVLLAVALTWPLAPGLFFLVPGSAPDDNAMFLWDFWWMRQALADGIGGFFHTPYLFHPSGVSLVLHTHAALPAFVGATLLGRLPLIAALNVTVLASCALNAFTAYLLAYRASRSAGAALIGGLFLAASPMLVNHLSGHFNFYSAWSLGLYAWCLLAALEQPGWRVVLAGASLAAVAFTDYYYFVYAAVFTVCVLASRGLDPRVRATSSWMAQTAIDRWLLAVAGVCAGLAVVVALTGGGVVTLGPIRLSLRTATNVRAIVTACLLCWVWRRRRPTLTGALTGTMARDLRTLSVLALVCGVLISPLLLAASHLWQAGEYVSQTYYWRSAPAGVDLGTLMMGNPFNAFWGPAIMRVYAALGIYGFDGPLWLGVAPLVLLLTSAGWSGRPEARLWVLIVAVFVLWAIGPFLSVFGVASGLPMPQTVLRLIPVVSNARIPAHAVVFVGYGMAVLLAMAVASAPRLRTATGLAVISMLIAVDFWAAPIPTFRFERPAIYEQLRTLPPGAVLEIPLGVRDGFGERGRFDATTMFYQSIHGKPMVGGYIARLPPSVAERYRSSPVLNALLELSAGQPAVPAPDPLEARNALSADGVRYIMVDTRLATPAVRAVVESTAGQPIARDGVRLLYRIE